MDDDEEEPEYREESEPEGLGSSDEDDLPSKKASASRAVHAPLPRSAQPDSDSDTEMPPATSAPTAPLSSITHSSRFNLTAPYEILLTSHPCRLPPPHHLEPQSDALLQDCPRQRSKADTPPRTQPDRLARLASQIVADPKSTSASCVVWPSLQALPSLRHPRRSPRSVPSRRKRSRPAEPQPRDRSRWKWRRRSDSWRCFDARRVRRHFAWVSHQESVGEGAGGEGRAGRGEEEGVRSWARRGVPRFPRVVRGRAQGCLRPPRWSRTAL